MCLTIMRLLLGFCAAALDQQGIRSPGDVFKRIEDVRAKVV